MPGRCLLCRFSLIVLLLGLACCQGRAASPWFFGQESRWRKRGVRPPHRKCRLGREEMGRCDWTAKRSTRCRRLPGDSQARRAGRPRSQRPRRRLPGPHPPPPDPLHPTRRPGIEAPPPRRNARQSHHDLPRNRSLPRTRYGVRVIPPNPTHPPDHANPSSDLPSQSCPSPQSRESEFRPPIPNPAHPTNHANPSSDTPHNP